MAYQLSGQYTWKQLEQGIVILNLDDGTYFTLNETASFIWRMLTENAVTDEIVQALQGEYNCSRQVAQEDVDTYIDTCLQEELILKIDS